MMRPPYFKGQRIRVIEAHPRSGVLGFLGTVETLTPTGVVVIIDNDPALTHRMIQIGGFTKPDPNRVVRRFFKLNEIEAVEKS